MKKIILFASVLIMTCICLCAQSIKKTSSVKEEEVPVAVRKAFENDFGKIPENGLWTVDIILQKEGSKTITKPILYTYSRRKPEKVEVRYTPEGRLYSVKGINKVSNTTALSDSTSS